MEFFGAKNSINNQAASPEPSGEGKQDGLRFKGILVSDDCTASNVNGLDGTGSFGCIGDVEDTEFNEMHSTFIYKDTALVTKGNVEDTEFNEMHNTFIYKDTALVTKGNFNTQSPFNNTKIIYSKKYTEATPGQFHLNKRIALYKTEMCRSYNEQGHCKYGDRCQFGHNATELRSVRRHPKYKTEICKTFWNDGSCPYGSRCCFIHLEEGIDAGGCEDPFLRIFSHGLEALVEARAIENDVTEKIERGGNAMKSIEDVKIERESVWDRNFIRKWRDEPVFFIFDGSKFEK